MAVGDVSTFGRAWRKTTRRRVAAQVGLAADTQELLSLDEVTRRLRLFEQRYLGVRPVPVSAIVGTVDRTRDFDRDFLPRRYEMEDRWSRVERAVQRGDIPPIVVYELEGRYFLVDGHHRVAVAKQLGIEYVDAEITIVRTRYPFPPGADLARVVHAQAKGVFMEESGLAGLEPRVEIESSSPAGYVELLEQVKVHGCDLMRELGRVAGPDEIARDWYHRVFLPTLASVREHGLPELFEVATEGDLFLAIHRRMRLMYFERERPTYEQTVKIAKEEATPKRRLASEALKAIGEVAPKRMKRD
jgi:hypothetical protein